MSTVAAEVSATADVPIHRRRCERFLNRIDRSASVLALAGLAWLLPVAHLLTGDAPRAQLKDLWHGLGLPLAGLLAFLVAWGQTAPRIETSLGAVPGPVQVWDQAKQLLADHRAERARAAAFHDRQAERNARLESQGRADRVKWRSYTGKSTYIDQIATSLATVALGFLLATIVAVPLGMLCGLSRWVNGAINPLVQIFRPISPLAWLPVITMIVSAVYVDPADALPKSLVVSALTVMLCSMWPTLINTALGVASVDKDLVNVVRVLKLPTRTMILRLVLPSAMPLMFTGLRLSLGVGWMVLIAAEMLAQNPGLGKFVWDEFQNGSSASLARIMVAVLTIGLIGFVLDRLMFALQAVVARSTQR